MKLGKAFSDNVTEEKRKVRRGSLDDSDTWWLGMGRLLFFITVGCAAFFIIFWRLFDITIIRGHYFRILADGNRTRELIRRAPRGIIYDRTGKPLTRNVPYYRLIRPCDGTKTDECVTDLSENEGNRMAKDGLPGGMYLEAAYRREYLYPQITSHVIGYTGEITHEELFDPYYSLRGYHAGDRIGRSGAEAVFEDKLRGRNGRELVEVEANGKVLRTLGRDREIAGQDITLSIDIALTEAAADAFPKGESGAVIGSNTQTGEILILYSSPSYNNNIFSAHIYSKTYQALLTVPDQPLFNRAIGGTYPPGSTFKILITLAALEEGVVKKDTTVEDVGILAIGTFQFPNWYFAQYGKTEGTVDIVKALQRSNDIFFYKTGEWIGITKLTSWARKIGLGKPLGIELPGEGSGIVPDPAWKKEYFSSPADRENRNDVWYLGDTYHVSIGQGYLLTTPLQVNTWTNIIGNSGKLCRPTIVKMQNSKILPSRQAGKIQNCKDLSIKKETIDLITEGMRRACEPGGTGWPFFGFAVARSSFIETQNASSSVIPRMMNYERSTLQIPVACKTGTAEFGDPKNRTHAWFTAFAPLPAEVLTKEGSTDSNKIITGDPELSITVLVEGAGEGSNVAAPVAKKIFEKWFSR